MPRTGDKYRGGNFERRTIQHVSFPVHEWVTKQTWITYHNTHQAGAEYQDAKHRNNPVHAKFHRPPVNKQPDRQRDAARDRKRGRDPDLGPVRDALSLVPFDHPVRQLPEADDAEHHAQTGGQEREAAVALAEAVVLRVHEREGGNKKIQDPVRDGDVQGHERDDGRQQQQLHRPDDGVLELLLGRQPPRELAAQLRVPRLLAKPEGLVLQDDGGERLE